MQALFSTSARHKQQRALPEGLLRHLTCMLLCRTLQAYVQQHHVQAELLQQCQHKVLALRQSAILSAWRQEQQRQRAKRQLMALVVAWRAQRIKHLTLAGELFCWWLLRAGAEQ